MESCFTALGFDLFAPWVTHAHKIFEIDYLIALYFILLKVNPIALSIFCRWLLINGPEVLLASPYLVAFNCSVLRMNQISSEICSRRWSLLAPTRALWLLAYVSVHMIEIEQFLLVSFQALSLITQEYLSNRYRKSSKSLGLVYVFLWLS